MERLGPEAHDLFFSILAPVRTTHGQSSYPPAGAGVHSSRHGAVAGEANGGSQGQSDAVVFALVQGPRKESLSPRVQTYTVEKLMLVKGGAAKERETQRAQELRTTARAAGVRGGLETSRGWVARYLNPTLPQVLSPWYTTTSSTSHKVSRVSAFSRPWSGAREGPTNNPSPLQDVFMDAGPLCLLLFIPNWLTASSVCSRTHTQMTVVVQCKKRSWRLKPNAACGLAWAGEGGGGYGALALAAKGLVRGGHPAGAGDAGDTGVQGPVPGESRQRSIVMSRVGDETGRRMENNASLGQVM
jgi:hypothetical protein